MYLDNALGAVPLDEARHRAHTHFGVSGELGKLEDHRAMGYLKGFKYKVNYHGCIPHIGVKEIRDVTFFKGQCPGCPCQGSIWLVQAVDPLKISTPQATGDISNKENGAPATADWQ